MGDIKVTEVYGESEKINDGLTAEHVIVSEELIGLLDIPEEDASIDLNELSIIREDDNEMLNALVRGNLFSIASAQYLIVKFVAKSDCKDMLQVLKSSTNPSSKVVRINVSGKYGFEASGKQLEAWELAMLEDRSALLTLTMRTKDVTF